MPVEMESREVLKRRALGTKFEHWRSVSQHVLLHYLWKLRGAAKSAAAMVRAYPDCEPAWGALANIYHGEARLFSSLDILCFEKVSSWLETPMKREILFRAFVEAIEAGSEALDSHATVQVEAGRRNRTSEMARLTTEIGRIRHLPDADTQSSTQRGRH